MEVDERIPVEVTLVLAARVDGDATGLAVRLSWP